MKKRKLKAEIDRLQAENERLTQQNVNLILANKYLNGVLEHQYHTPGLPPGQTYGHDPMDGWPPAVGDDGSEYAPSTLPATCPWTMTTNAKPGDQWYCMQVPPRDPNEPIHVYSFGGKQ